MKIYWKLVDKAIDSVKWGERKEIKIDEEYVLDIDKSVKTNKEHCHYITIIKTIKDNRNNEDKATDLSPHWKKLREKSLKTKNNI